MLEVSSPQLMMSGDVDHNLLALNRENACTKQALSTGHRLER